MVEPEAVSIVCGLLSVAMLIVMHVIESEQARMWLGDK